MMTMRTVEYSYQVSLKVEEKLARKKSQWNRGKSPSRGRGTLEKSSRSPDQKLEDITVRQREEEVLEEDTMVEETLFLEEEEEVEEEK
jgi:hypothetical protein